MWSLKARKARQARQGRQLYMGRVAPWLTNHPQGFEFVDFGLVVNRTITDRTTFLRS